jgi:hypothetical protein
VSTGSFGSWESQPAKSRAKKSTRETKALGRAKVIFRDKEKLFYGKLLIIIDREAWMIPAEPSPAGAAGPLHIKRDTHKIYQKLK